MTRDDGERLATEGLRLRTEVRPSTIAGAGLGLFALEPRPRGAWLGMDFPDPKLATDSASVLEQPPELRKFAWRHVENVCFFAHHRRAPADYLNHAFDPNVLWHLGHYFARRAIVPGDELTVDYRFVSAPEWGPRVHDAASGRPIVGFEWREALREGARQLLELLDDGTPLSSSFL